MVFLILFLILAAAAAPFVLFAGWLWAHWTTARQASQLAGDPSDFWLGASEKKAFIQAITQLTAAEIRCDELEAEANRRRLSRNLDGTVSRRSRVGKALAAEAARASEARLTCEVLALLPLSRWSELNESCRRKNRFMFGAITWITIAVFLPVAYGQVPLVASLESHWDLLNSFTSDYVGYSGTGAHSNFPWLAPLCSTVAFFLGGQLPDDPAAKVSPKPELVTVENIDSPKYSRAGRRGQPTSRKGKASVKRRGQSAPRTSKVSKPPKKSHPKNPSPAIPPRQAGGEVETKGLRLLPSPDGYRAMTQQFREERPLCGFYFILDGSKSKGHKLSYGVAGGNVPMVWQDRVNGRLSFLVEWRVLCAQSDEELKRGFSNEAMERQGGKGYYWLGDRPELTRSLILGEEIVATWDAKVPVQKPCAWLLCLALQSAKNHHAPLPGDHPVFDEERSAESWGHGQFYLERFEPTVRRHVVPGQKGAPDTLVIGLVVRAEKESELDELADREGSEFCFPLSATSDDPQSWAQLEFFAEMFSCFYAIQVEPYLGSPFILHAPITHSFHELDDLARVRSAQDLPSGDRDEDRPRPQPEEVAANRMAFIERVCHEWGLRGADEIDRLVETARDEVRTEREREERDAEEIQRLVAAELAGEAAEPVDAEWSSTAPFASEIPRLLGPSDASQQSEAPHPSAPPQSAVQRDPRDRDFAAYQAAGLVGAPEDLKAPVPPAVADKVKKAILDVLQQEGPVEELRLGKLVANAFGIKRVRASRIEVVLEHVPGEQRRSSEFGAFIWPPSLRPDTWSYFQRQQSGEEGTRAIKEISPEEVRNALLYLVETEGGISRPDAIADLAAIFGVKRVSKGVRERLDSLISHSLASGDCTEEGGRLIAAN